MKKVLVLASVASMIEQFNMKNIRMLLDNGYDVDVIANFEHGNTISIEKILKLKEKLRTLGVKVIHVSIPRNILDIKNIISSLKVVKQYCDKNKYELIHCHSPIGSVIARLAAIKIRKSGTKVIYTAHGFHFYKGAPLKNWITFFPIEKICSYITDVLITINKEDYEFAKKNMSAKCIEYIPGIGIETSKFYLEDYDVHSKRKLLNLSENNIVLLSVGELNDNKNHEIVVRAISKLNDNNIHYIIAGQGYKKDYLNNLAKELNVNLHLLGYRDDIPDLLNVADIYIFPSFREGLSVALMEAMASGLPCIVSNIRGNVDLIIPSEGGYLCKADSEEEFMFAINDLKDRQLRLKMGDYNKNKVKEFDALKVNEKMRSIYFNK